MKKPIIVLSTHTMPMEEPFRQRYHYTNTFNTAAITKAGGIPLMPCYVDDEMALEVLSRADGLFLTGGVDISPALYGQETLPVCKSTDPDRDKSDYCLLRAALQLKKPVFCVCRGFQLANAYFGGTLYQDLNTQYENCLRHPVYDYPDHTLETAHKVTLVPGTPLQQLLGLEELPVNSLHHQGVDQLAPCLRPMAYATDGLLESWYLPDDSQWLWAVQWHPEMMADSPRADAIFRAFLAACRR